MSETAFPSESASAMTYECSMCLWKKHTTPKSEVLVEGVDVFYNCPSCGNKKIKSYQKKSRLERWIAGL